MARVVRQPGVRRSLVTQGLLAVLLSCSMSCRSSDNEPDRSIDPVDETGSWSLARSVENLSGRPTNGPLTVSEKNPRYFADAEGDPVLLVGSHTWNNLQDMGVDTPIPAFAYPEFLAFLEERGHNFFRLWVHENARGHPGVPLEELRIEPLPFMRAGPGPALDGGPKFDLDRFNEDYFARLRERVQLAGKHGIYVAVMLFNGWTVASQKADSDFANPWLSHPFNRHNNVNGIDGDPDGDDSGEESHELANEAVLSYQEKYVRKVIDTVGDLDNVLFEISNESHSESTDWQYYLIRFIKEYQATRSLQHPVGMTVEYPGGRNDELMRSTADWISPRGKLGQPVQVDGRKVWIADTDHLCGICGDVPWVWKSFLQGQNPILMDFYQAETTKAMRTPIDTGDDRWENVRRNLGFVRALAERIGIGEAVPRPDLASSGYCLASFVNGKGTLVVFSPGDEVTIDLSRIRGSANVFRIDFRDGSVVPIERVAGGGSVAFSVPRHDGFVLLIEQGTLSAADP